MSLERYEENVDLNKYPTTIHDPKGQHIALGDIHGNAKKLIFCLIKEGILHISPADYAKIVEIYGSKDLNTASLDEFIHIIDKKATINKPAQLHLLGDLLADRGKNDYLTLKVLEKLGESRVNYEILFSNHDAEFLRIWQMYLTQEKGKNKIPLQTVAPKQHLSVTRFWDMVGTIHSDNKQESSDILNNVAKILSKHYLPKLKILSGFVLPESKTDQQSAPQGSYVHLSHAPTELATAFETLKQHYQLDGKKPKNLPKFVKELNKLNQEFCEDVSKESFFKKWQRQNRDWGEYERDLTHQYTKVCVKLTAPTVLEENALYLVLDESKPQLNIQTADIKNKEPKSLPCSELKKILNITDDITEQVITNSDQIKKIKSLCGFSAGGWFINPKNTPLVYPAWSRMAPKISEMNPLDDQDLKINHIFGHTHKGQSVTQDKNLNPCMSNLDGDLGGLRADDKEINEGVYTVVRARDALTLEEYLDKNKDAKEDKSSGKTETESEDGIWGTLCASMRFFRKQYPKSNKTLTYTAYSGLTLSLTLALTAGLGWLKHSGDFHYYLDLPMPGMPYLDVKQGASAVALACLLFIVMGYLLSQCVNINETEERQDVFFPDQNLGKLTGNSTEILPLLLRGTQSLDQAQTLTDTPS